MSRRFGTVPFISGMFVMSCATIPGIEFIIWKLRFVRVCELQMKWKINIEAARLACPKSKDEAHFFPLPLFVPGHRRVSTQNMPAARPRWMLIFHFIWSFRTRVQKATFNTWNLAQLIRTFHWWRAQCRNVWTFVKILALSQTFITFIYCSNKCHAA